jgi:[acyl-carrier-protein] S-malonyltransferase
VAAEALPFTEALLLVRERGRLMKEAGERRPGGMAAILGLDEATVEEICAQEEVAVANYNCPGQVVISGAREALERALQAAQEKGARRVVPLAVSIAAHSPLIAPIAEAFARCLASISFQRARIPILANLTAQPIASPQELKDELSRQLTSPVRWSESVQRMIREGVNTFLEVGPGEVLKGLIKRIDQEVRAVSAFDLEGVERALALVAMEELG